MVKNLPTNGRGCKRHGFNPWVGKIPWRKKWQPTLGFLPGESHRQRSLAGYSPRGHKDLDMIERVRACVCGHIHRHTHINTDIQTHTQRHRDTPTYTHTHTMRGLLEKI